MRHLRVCRILRGTEIINGGSKSNARASCVREPGKVQKDGLRRPYSVFALVRLLSVMCEIHKPGNREGNREGSPFLERKMYPLEDRAEDWGQFFLGNRLGAGWKVLNNTVCATLIKIRKLILKERRSCCIASRGC